MKIKILIMTMLVLFSGVASAAEPQEEIKNQLMLRHFSASLEQLQEIAGDEDNLAEILLELRNDEKTPFVAVRAQKLLLGLSGRADVANALESDIQNRSRLGLARVTLLHLTAVKSPDVRARLARAAVAQSRVDSRLSSSVARLQQSDDERVRRIVSAE